MTSKLMRVSDAVRNFIRPGTHLGIGGFSSCRNAMVVSHEIIRQKIGRLHISSVNPAFGVDILIGAGLVAVVESGCLNMERLGLPRNFCRAVEKGLIKSEDYEHLGKTMRYLAGALGIPFIPVKSALGSDIVTSWTVSEKKLILGACPFTGEKVVLLPACTPDVAVVMVSRADEAGNCQVDGSGFADEYIAKASARIIVVAEEIVSDDFIRCHPQETLIPAYRVDAVIHQPWGAYPTSMPGKYDYDYDALTHYQSTARDTQAFQAYLEENVLQVAGFGDYLDKALTVSRMQSLCNDPRLGYSGEVAKVVTNGGFTGEMPAGYTRNEMMIVAAAHQMRDGEVAIIGTGLPMAASGLAIRTHAPNLNYVVETGIGNVCPQHACLSVADTRLLGAARPTFVRDIVESLGFMVQRGVADLGFLGGAEIDMYGNLNATSVGDYHRPDKRFPGSGGANSIASCAKTLPDHHQARKAPFRGARRIHHQPGVYQRRRFAQRVGPAGRRAGPGDHRSGDSRLRAGIKADARDLAAPGCHPRAGPGGHRLRAAVRRRGGPDPDADGRRARHPAFEHRARLPRRLTPGPSDRAPE